MGGQPHCTSGEATGLEERETAPRLDQLGGRRRARHAVARLLADSRPEGRGEADRDLTKTQRHTGPQMPPKVQGREKRAKADETSGAGTEDVQRWEVRLRSRKRTLFED